MKDDAAPPYRIAVLLSGTGRTLANLIERRSDTACPERIVRVISSRHGVRGIDIARGNDIPVEVIPRRSFQDVNTFSDAITARLDADAPDLVVMAGFMCFYAVPDRWVGRIINIHPSLLPLFGGKGYYGHRVHEAVIASGMRVSGCTVHFVDNEYDHGPILVQRACPVMPHDDAHALAARVFEQECRALPDAIDCLRDGRARFADGRVIWV